MKLDNGSFFLKRRAQGKHLLHILLEVLFSVLLVLIIEILFRAGGYDPFMLSPHPYWIFIILFAVRYGSSAGVLSALAFSVLYILQGQYIFHEYHDIGEQMRLLLKNPVLFVVAGLVIGYFVDDYHAHIKLLQKMLEDAKKNLDELSRKFITLRGSKEKMENKLLSEEQTAFSLYEAAKKLERLNIAKLYDSVLELLQNFARVRKATFYAFENNELRLKASLGWAEGQVPEIIDESDLLFTEIIQKQKQMILRHQEWVDVERQLNGFISAYPIILTQDKIFGMIKIEEMDFIDLNLTNMKFIQMIVEWTQIIFSNAMKYQTQIDKNIENDITGAYTYSYFLERLRKEMKLSQRYSLNLTVIRLSVKDFHSFPTNFQQSAVNVMGLIFKNVLRDVDIIAHLLLPADFAIILPCTPSESADTVVGRLKEEVDNIRLKPFPGEDRLMEIDTQVYDAAHYHSNAEELVEKFNS